MSSTHQTHSPHESKEDTEFSFWGSPPNNTISCEKNDCDQIGGNETGLLQRAIVSNSDPSSRSKAIEEGRKELMEMMQDMPESSYELSFQDMVVEEQQPQPQPQQVPQPQPDSRSEAQQLQQKKLKKEKKEKNKRNNRPGQILRVESMDSETFLLKMFFPTSLDWMKKPKVQNGSKVSPKQVDNKKCKIKRIFTEQNTDGSSSSNDKSRKVDRSFSFSHGCWPFFHYIKSKTKKLGG